MKKENLHSYSVFLAFTLALILYHAFGYIGHYGYDDIHYASLAADLLEGIFDWEDHYSYRLPVIFLTALSYAVFGISDLASSLPAMLMSLLTLWLVFMVLKDRGVRVLVFGLSLTLCTNWYISYSDKLMPDIYIAFFVMLALFILQRYKYSRRFADTDGVRRTILHSIGFSLALLFGFMSKGTIVLVLPLLLVLFLIDLSYRRDLGFWAWSAVSGILLLILYFMITGLITGDPLKRFGAIASNSYLNLCSYDQQSFAILLRRISFEFFEMGIYQVLLTGFVFVIPSAFSGKFMDYLKLKDPFSLFFISSLILLLSSNFMSISLRTYSPMCLDPRHYLFLVPVVAIPASVILNDFLANRENQGGIIIAAAGMAVISLFVQGNSFWKLYLPLTLLLITAPVYKEYLPNLSADKEEWYRTLFTVLLVIVLALKPYEMIPWAKTVDYPEQKKVSKEMVLTASQGRRVITNTVQKRLLSYYMGFRDEDQVLMNYNELSLELDEGRNSIWEGEYLLFLNRYTRSLSGMTYEDLPSWARNYSRESRLVHENERLGMEIHEIRQLLLPTAGGIPLFTTLNDFESEIPHWSMDTENISSEYRFAGEVSGQIEEYSSTFSYPLDSLDIPDSSFLMVKVSLHCYFDDVTNAKLVLSLEDKSNTYSWRGMELNRFIKAYSNWWPVEFEIEIDPADIHPGSLMKVYIWNEDRELSYVDEFRIDIFSITNPSEIN